MQDLFSADYATARARFRQAAETVGFELISYPVDGLGPAGEELSMDVAKSAPGARSQTLVLSSGMHGVEGFFGSAVQLGVLRRWSEWAESMSTRLVLLHALNPHGFAWLRRTDDDNVDLNRNFLEPGEPYAGSPPLYGRLDKVLNPGRPPSKIDPFTLKAVWHVARWGMPALKQAIAAGQFDFPRGLFYGGEKPSWVHRLVSGQLDNWLEDSPEVVHLDFHTGLGRWGRCKLLVDYPLSQTQRRGLADCFGAESFEQGHARGVSYQTRGSWGRWCVRRQVERRYLFAFAEFGTYGLPRILAGLRAENQAHFWARPSPGPDDWVKRRLRDLLCPDDPRWRTAVLKRSFQLVRQALSGLSTGMT